MGTLNEIMAEVPKLKRRIERMMQVAKDTKKDFAYNKSTGKWSWHEDEEFDTFLECLEDAVAPYFSNSDDDHYTHLSNGYILPSQATRIRVFDEGWNWAIDAADESGEHTETCWTHYNDEPMGVDEAIKAVAEFADEIGRPDLKNNVYCESEDGSWAKLQIAE